MEPLKRFSSSFGDINYEFMNVFQNPNKLPITEVFIEKKWTELKPDFPKNVKLHELTKYLPEKVLENKSELLPALDKRWLSKFNCFFYEPYNFSEPDNYLYFVDQNRLFLQTLEFLLNCSYHQFWCTILFNSDIITSLKSYLLNPVLPYQVEEIHTSAVKLYKNIFVTFELVYERLLNFYVNEEEYMSEAYGLSKLIDLKLLNLPIVVTLAVLYQENYSGFIHMLFKKYWGFTKQKDFIAKEMETMVEQNFIILETLYYHAKGNSNNFTNETTMVPITLEKRPRIYSLKWIYLFTTYLLNITELLRVLFVYHKPAVQIALEKNFATQLPSLYVKIYKEIYDVLRPDGDDTTLFDRVMAHLSLSRWTFVELFHEVVSFCLDEILKQDRRSPLQEPMIENYLKLFTAALDEEYFIYDYDKEHPVADLNGILEDYSNVDATRTQFIASCIEKLSLSITLPKQQSLIEKTFTEFVPAIHKKPTAVLPPVAVVHPEPQAGPSGLHSQQQQQNSKYLDDIETKIESIIEMFPFLGDAFVLKCLEAYNFMEVQVINAILENNLPPHLHEIPFDQIRIPPEPEPEKPILAYKGKKPEVDDALYMLDDKSQMKELKPIILEGLQCNYDSIYDDEYDDRFDDEAEIKVQDNPLDEEINPNPNHDNRQRQEETSSEEDDEEAEGTSERNKLNFCEDPALLREKREARFQSKQAQSKGKKNPAAHNVKGNAKGQGQSKSTLLNRQRKEANKSSVGNHNRKGGAQWKRNRGMIPS